MVVHVSGTPLSGTIVHVKMAGPMITVKQVLVI